MLNMQFSRIVTGNSFSNFGNYAAIKSADESLKASMSFLNKDGGILSAQISGGATEGITSFFEDGELNSKTSAKLTYHLLVHPLGSASISRDYLERDELVDSMEKIRLKYKADAIAIEHKRELIEAKSSLIKSESKQGKILLAIERLDNGSDATTNPETKAFKNDSLSYEMDKTVFDIDVLNRKILKLNTEEFWLEQEIKLEQKFYKDSLDIANKVKKISPQSINITWFSFGYGAGKDAFKLFDPAADFESQIVKQEYVSHEVNLAVSKYRWRAYDPNDVFWSVGLNISNTNNLGSLTSTELQDTEEVSASPRRDKVGTQKVYTGTYEEDKINIIIFVDYYRFFGKGTRDKTSLALHLNPKLINKGGGKSVASLHSGLMLPFKKVSEETSIVNFEVFYRFNDVFNVLESDNSLLGRNTVGFQATFPINFLTTKN
tara:strand:+ start:58957 stop:60258 length:1302 start_codon:yes stop_codon:yes gene_type:complete